MMGSPEHISLEQLNDLVDGRLDIKAEAMVFQHITECDACRREHESLRSLLAVASSSDRSVDPGEDLWPDIRAAIDSTKEVALPVHVHAPNAPRQASATRTRPAFLAAAAVVLMVLSSAITALVLRRSPPANFSAVSGALKPGMRPVR